VNTGSLEGSIRILQSSDIDYEFRTTYTPELDQHDLLDIARSIKGAKRYVLQQYREVDATSGGYTGRAEKRNLLGSLRSDIMRNVHTMQFRGEFAFV
jgi:pyruvate formate lyase activating enzyme